MAKGRPVDPGRAKRGTGNRPAQGKKKAATDAIVLAEPAPLCTADLPAPPEGLPEVIHEAWYVAVAEMGGNGHLRPIDLEHLEVWAWAKWEFHDASAKLAMGTIVKGPNGPMKNPAHQIAKDAAATMRMYSDMLGLNPGARIRLGLMEIAGMSLLAGLNESLDRR